MGLHALARKTVVFDVAFRGKGEGDILANLYSVRNVKVIQADVISSRRLKECYPWLIVLDQIRSGALVGIYVAADVPKAITQSPKETTRHLHTECNHPASRDQQSFFKTFSSVPRVSVIDCNCGLTGQNSDLQSTSALVALSAT